MSSRSHLLDSSTRPSSPSPAWNPVDWLECSWNCPFQYVDGVGRPCRVAGPRLCGESRASLAPMEMNTRRRSSLLSVGKRKEETFSDGSRWASSACALYHETGEENLAFRIPRIDFGGGGGGRPWSTSPSAPVEAVRSGRGPHGRRRINSHPYTHPVDARVSVCVCV